MAAALSKKIKEGELLYAAIHGEKEELLELLQDGKVHVDYRGELGETAVMKAISEGCPDIVDALIHHGCNLEIQNDIGETALMLAAGSDIEKKEVVTRLIASKCSLNTQSSALKTAFINACVKGHVASAILLIESGCDYTLRDKSGKAGVDYLQEKDPEKVHVVQAAIDARIRLVQQEEAALILKNEQELAAAMRRKLVAEYQEDIIPMKAMLHDDVGLSPSVAGRIAETLVLDHQISSVKIFQRKVGPDVAGYCALLQLDDIGTQLVKEYFMHMKASQAVPRHTLSHSGKEFVILGGVVTDSIPFVSTQSEKSNPLYDGIWSGTLNNLGKDLAVIVKENARTRSIYHEALIFRHLQSHKDTITGCIHMYGLDLQEPPSFIVFERFGINLHTKLALQKNMDIGKKRLIMKNIVRAVADLHGLGVMHGDIKPQNILVNEDDVKLCDLDSARIISENNIFAFDSETNKLKCSPSWISPEVYTASNDHQGGVAEASFAIDMFSLGLIVALLEDKSNHYPGGIVLPPGDTQEYHQALTDQAYLYDSVLHVDSGAVFYDIIVSMCSFDQSLRPTSAEVFRIVEGKTSLTAYTNSQKKTENQIHFLQDQVIRRLDNIADILHQFSDKMTELAASNKGVEGLLHQISNQIAYMSEEQSQEMTKLHGEIQQATATLHALPSSFQSAIIEQITVTNNKINTILQDTWRIPMLAVVLKTSKNRVFRDDYALHFLCEHTLQLVPCGPNGEGFEFKQLKTKYASIFQKLAPVLMIGLVMLKIAVTVYGIPIPLPDLKDLSQEVATKLLNEIITDLDVHDVDTNIQEIARSPNPLQMIDQVAVTTEQQREAYESLMQFLDKQEYKPHKFGLVKVTCEKSGITKWIKNDPLVIKSFRDNEGRPVYKIK